MTAAAVLTLPAVHTQQWHYDQLNQDQLTQLLKVANPLASK